MAKRRSNQITEETYPLIPFEDIELLDAPKAGEKRVLLNPRGLDGTDKYTREQLASLIRSIQIDGLQQPLITRIITENNRVKSTQLLAGNGRRWSIFYLREDDAPVYDDKKAKKSRYSKGEWVIWHGQLCIVLSAQKQQYTIKSDKGEQHIVPIGELLPTVSARKKYAKVPCKVHHDIDDWHAMRLSFDENDKRRDLTIAEEIALVEYYLTEGFSQREIKDLINQSETWVSQTATFRTALPEGAFEKLLKGEMMRHGAVNLLSFKEKEVRQEVFNAAIEDEKRETEAELAVVEDAVIEASDAEQIAVTEVKEAKKTKDTKRQKRAEREVKTAQKATKQARKKKDRIKKNSGKITQGNIERGATKVGAKTRKGKMLSRQQLIEFSETLEKYIKAGGITDPLVEEEIPTTTLRFAKAMADGILNGETDPLVPIRDIHLEFSKKWQKKVTSKEQLDDISEPTDEDLENFEDGLVDQGDDYRDDYDEYHDDQEFLDQYAL